MDTGTAGGDPEDSQGDHPRHQNSWNPNGFAGEGGSRRRSQIPHGSDRHHLAVAYTFFGCFALGVAEDSAHAWRWSFGAITTNKQTAPDIKEPRDYFPTSSTTFDPFFHNPLWSRRQTCKSTCSTPQSSFALFRNMTSDSVDSGFHRSNDPEAPSSYVTIPFRQLIPSPDHPRIAGIAEHDALSWCHSRQKIPAPAWLINRLHIDNIERPYKGFSSDGNPRPMFRYQVDEGAPVHEACEAVDKLLAHLSENDKAEVVRGDVADDDEFRAWSNPELYVNPGELTGRSSSARCNTERRRYSTRSSLRRDSTTDS